MATLRGNVPYTTSFMLRLLTYIKGSSVKDYAKLTTNTVQLINKEKFKKHKKDIETTDVTNIVVRRKVYNLVFKFLDSGSA